MGERKSRIEDAFMDTLHGLGVTNETLKLILFQVKNGDESLIDAIVRRGAPQTIAMVNAGDVWEQMEWRAKQMRHGCHLRPINPSFPNGSTQVVMSGSPTYSEEMRLALRWLKSTLRRLGITCSLWQSSDDPFEESRFRQCPSSRQLPPKDKPEWLILGLASFGDGTGETAGIEYLMHLAQQPLEVRKLNVRAGDEITTVIVEGVEFLDGYGCWGMLRLDFEPDGIKLMSHRQTDTGTGEWLTPRIFHHAT
jgi:hypothetical protein